MKDIHGYTSIKWTCPLCTVYESAKVQSMGAHLTYCGRKTPDALRDEHQPNSEVMDAHIRKNEIAVKYESSTTKGEVGNPRLAGLCFDRRSSSSHPPRRYYVLFRCLTILRQGAGRVPSNSLLDRVLLQRLRNRCELDTCQTLFELSSFLANFITLRKLIRDYRKRDLQLRWLPAQDFGKNCTIFSLIDSRLSDIIHFRRGVKQGYPLSPLLFAVCG